MRKQNRCLFVQFFSYKQFSSKAILSTILFLSFDSCDVTDIDDNTLFVITIDLYKNDKSSVKRPIILK
jgi:hypothetical protein